MYPLIKKEESKKKTKKRKVNKEDVIEWVWPESNTRGIVVLKVKSFALGTLKNYYTSLKRGFKKLNKATEAGEVEALAIDLRGNLGGSADRVVILLNFIIDEKFSSPKSIVIKQCDESKEQFNDIYKGFTKRIVDRFEHKNKDLAELKRLALLEVGEVDTLSFEPSVLAFKNKYLGNSCVLIDGLSASGSVAFASVYLELIKGPIIGEPCMGPITGTFANPIMRSLPNSQITINISSAQFIMDSAYRWSPTPIEPTRWVEYNIEDLKHENDPYMMAIDDWINHPEVNVDYLFGNRESSRLFMELESAFSSNRDWSGELRAEVFEEIKKCDLAITDLSKRLKDIERSDSSEEVIYKGMRDNRQLKKDGKKLRDASINIKLTPEMRPIYSELTSPFRPAVLHFGIHNRADCNVCKKN